MILDYVKLFFIIISTIVGVGFLSGAEIYSFFARFSICGFFGIIVFFILNLIVLYNLLGDFAHKKSKLKEIVILFDITITSSAMISGLKHFIYLTFPKFFVILYVFVLLFVLILLYSGKEILAKFDFVVVIFLCVIVFVVTKDLYQKELFFDVNTINFNKFLPQSAFFAVLYVFMNVIQIKPIIDNFKINFSRKTKFLFSFFVSLFLSLILLCFYLFLCSNPSICSLKMPLLSYFGNEGIMSIFYKICLFFALVSSMVGCMFGIKNYLIKNKKTSNFCATLLTFCFTFFIGFIDFNFFVTILYPLMGFINFVVFIFF